MTDTVSTTQNTDSVRAGAQQAFRNHLDYLSSGRISEWVDLFTEDGVLEFPYAPKGFPTRTEGKEGLYDYMKNFPEHFKVEFVDLHFHETVDPSLVIAEFKSRGTALATGRPYDQTYISVVETKDGKISRYVDSRGSRRLGFHVTTGSVLSAHPRVRRRGPFTRQPPPAAAATQTPQKSPSSISA